MLTHINYVNHPTNRSKMVFHFTEVKHATYFENLLKENKINYERQIDTEGDGKVYIGVMKSDYKLAKRLNFITFGHFREPFINVPFFKYLVIIIFAIGLLLAIFGAIHSS